MSRPSAQSAQRYPITTIFGTEANVRLVRELATHGGQLSGPDLAVRTKLARASTWRALLSLEKTGIIESTGSGRVRLYNLRTEHPLSVAIAALFEAEEMRFAAIRDAVREAASKNAYGLLAVWIYGSFARGEDHLDSDLDIVIVVEPNNTARAANGIRDALISPGEKLGFAPSVVELERDDIERLAHQRDPWSLGVSADAITVFGVRPVNIFARLQPEDFREV